MPAEAGGSAGWQVHRLLRAGVLASSALMGAGLLLSAFGWGGGQAMMRAGIGLLIATPVARVAWLAVAFGAARDWAFCAVSAGVLALLGLGALLGAR